MHNEAPIEVTNVIWHPYPKEKPPEEDSYLATVDNFVIICTYPFWGWEEKNITAWAEVPMYDKRRKRNDAIHWHSYPNEKPDNISSYLVSAIYNRSRFTTIDMWIPNMKVFLKEEDELKIIAWAELPEPYKEES